MEADDMDMMTNPLVRSGATGNNGDEGFDADAYIASGQWAASPQQPQAPPLSRQPNIAYPTATGGSPLAPATLPPATTTPLSRQQQRPADTFDADAYIASLPLTGGATPATTGTPSVATPPPPDRGVLGETYAAVAGGAFEGLRTGVQALRAVTESPYTEEPSTLRKLSERMTQYQKESPTLQESPNMGEWGKAAFGGLRSATQSLMFGVPGMVAGTLAGPPGWVAGAIGYATGHAVPFTLAQFQETMDRGVENYMRQGMSREQAVNKTMPEAIVQATAEGGFEWLSDFLMGKFMTGNPLTRPTVDAVKASIRDLTKTSMKELAGRFGKTALAETGTEVLTGGFQAQSDTRLGIGNSTFWEGAKESFGPAFVASMIFGGLGHVERKHLQSRMLNTLENPEANIADRTRVAHEVYRTLLSYDEKVANIWWDNAKDALVGRQAITTNEDILNLQERKAQLSSLELKSAFEEKYAQKVDAALKDAKERLGGAREQRDTAEEAWAKYQPTMEAQRQAIVDRVEAAKGGEDFAKVKKSAKKELAALDKEANNLRKAAEDGRKAQAAVERDIAVSHDKLYNMWRPPEMGEEYQAAGGAGIPGGPTVEVRPAGSPLARASQMAADLAKDASARRRKITAERDLTFEQRRQAEAEGKEWLAREEEVNNLFAAFDAESRAAMGEVAGAVEAEQGFALDENKQEIVAGLQGKQPTPSPIGTESLADTVTPAEAGNIPAATPNIAQETPEQAEVRRLAESDAQRALAQQAGAQALRQRPPMEKPRDVTPPVAGGPIPQAPPKGLKYSLVEGGAATPATTTIDPGIRDAILSTVVRLSDRVSAGLRVAPTFSALPQQLQDGAIAKYGPEAATRVRGVQDPETGQHWLVADRLESPYAAQHTLLHEVGHAVKRGVHGSDAGAAFFRGLYEAKRNLMGGYAANYGADTTTPEGRALVAEEWWMDMMAQGRYGGGKFASAWAKYVKVFNNALRTMGFDITVSERELAGWAKAYRDGMFGDTAWAVATPAVEPSPASATTPTTSPTEAAGTPATGDQRYSLLGPTATQSDRLKSVWYSGGEDIRKNKGAGGRETSIPQFPAGMDSYVKLGIAKPGGVHFANGEGLFDLGQIVLNAQGVTSYPVDPYNRSEGRNRQSYDALAARGGADTSSLPNALNVIRDYDEALDAVERTYAPLKPGGKMVIQVYEGNRKGVWDGSQQNRPTKWYEQFVREVVGPKADISYLMGGKLMVVTKPEGDSTYFPPWKQGYEPPAGKIVKGVKYVHVNYLDTSVFTPEEVAIVKQRMAAAPAGDWIIAKIDRKGAVSLMESDDFDTATEPRTSKSIRFAPDGTPGRVVDYSRSDNPNIYHGKHTLVLPDYQGEGFDYVAAEKRFSQWKSQGFPDVMDLGLHQIGRKKTWEGEVEPYIGDQVRYSLLGPTATNWGSLLGRFSSLYDRKEKAWIDDSQSSLTAGWDILPTTPIGADVRTVATNTVPLSSVFDHPTLYAAYPELADMQVRRQEMRDPGAVAHYDDDRNLVLLSANVTDPAEIRRIIMHEAAHWVQRKEGWGRGGSPVMDLVLDNYDKVLRAAEKAPRADELVPQMEKLGTVLSSFNSMRDEIRLAKEAYRLRENEVTQLRDAVESQLTTLRAAPSPADAATINKLESLRREYTAELYDTTGATDLGSRQQRLDEAKEAYAAARQPYAGVEFLAYQLLSGEVEARFVADMLNEQEKWGKFNTSLGMLRQEARDLDAAKHAVDVATTAAFAKGWDGVTATPPVADARERYKEAYTTLNSRLRPLGVEDGLPIDTPSQRTLLDTILNGSDRQVAAALDIHNPATIGMYTIEDIPPDMAITRFEVEKEVADAGGMTAAVEDGVVDLQRLGEGTGVRYSLVPPATTTSANPLTTAATAARNYRDAATDFLVPIRGAWSDIVSRLLRATVPGAASPQHLQAAETFSTHVGVKNHLQEVMGHRLQAANDYFTRNPKEMWQWASAVMTGKPLTGKLKEYADLVNTMLEEARGYLDAAGVPLEAVRPHYFPGIWTNESIRAFNQALQEEVDAGTINPATFDVNTADAATKKRVADRVAVLLKARQGIDGDQAMAAFAKRPLSGSESFRRGKVFDDVVVAREFGLVPKSEHVIDIVKMKLDEMYRSAMGANAVQEFKAKGEIVPTGRDGKPLDPNTLRPIPDAAPLSPDEWVPVNDRFGTIWYRNDRGELVKRGQYLARIPTADILNNYLSSPIYSDPTFGRLFRMYRGVADALNQFQLGVGSMFHAGFTTGETLISGLANNIKDAYKWRNGEIDAAEFMRGVAHTLTSPYSNPKQGSEYLKAYLNGEGGKFAMDVVRAVELVGAKTQLDFDLRTQQLEEMKRDWYSDKKLKAIMRSPVAFTEYIARPIMTHLVPRQKLGVFGELVRRIQRDNPGVALENLVPELRKAWNRVDSRLGQVVYDRIYAHNVAKNAVQAMMRAPGWTFGTIAEVGGSVKDTKDFLKEWIKTGKAPANIPDRMAYTMSLVVVSAALNAALTYMFTGEPPEGMDYWSFRTGDKDEYGRPERFMLPTYAKDLVAYWRHPTSTLSHKIHPLLSVINEAVIQNKDYYGVEVRNPGDNPIKQLADVGKFGIKQFIPFWMRGVGKEVEREGGEGIGGAFNLLATRPAKTVAPLVGIMPAPAEYNKSAAERLMTQIGAEERASGAITQKEREHFDLKRRIRHDYMVGKEREAEARMQGAIQQGLLSKREINQLRKTRGETPTSYVFKRLNAEDALRVWSVMNPDERKAASGELMVKMRSVLKNSSPAKRAELLPQFKEALAGNR